MRGMIWPDFNQNSEFSQKLILAKQTNDINYWPIMREILAHDCASLPLSRFRLWVSAHNIPFITTWKTSRFIGAAFHAAFQDIDVANALVENWIGIPREMADELKVTSDFDTSMQRIQDVSHLATCGFTIEDIRRYKSIVEIGGGYGDMCSVIYAMGFTGKYTIYDFPEVQQVQKYYLENQNIQPNFITESEELEPADLVIGTWSLSEIPLELREKIVDRIYESPNWLIMYQTRVFGGDFNEKYFIERFKDKKPKYLLHNETPTDGKNLYMIIRGK